jgi:ribosome recycling factor
MLEDVKKDANERMNKCVTALKNELKKLRTGRAHTSLLEHIRVEYYGNEVPLNQVANLAVEDARTLTVTPWEKPMVQVIEKAIMKSDLGLMPNTAGTVIRVPMPPLTEERRRDLVKQTHKKLDEAKVAVRNIRRDAHDHLRAQEKSKEITADDLKQETDRLQKLTDRQIAELDQVGQAKEREIMEI